MFVYYTYRQKKKDYKWKAATSEVLWRSSVSSSTLSDMQATRMGQFDVCKSHSGLQVLLLVLNIYSPTDESLRKDKKLS